MEVDSSGNPNWLFDYELMTDITSAASVTVADFQSPATIDFSWPAQTIYASSNLIAETDYTFADSEVSKEASSRKSSPRSKACREKLRRDRLNERFLELSSVLDPGRPPKTEKVAILSDAQRMLIELRTETQKLKESNKELQEKIKELKAEKNELRDEKQRLKEEKENLEQQVKSLASKPGFLSHPSAMGASFTAQGQVAAGNKLMPFIGYPSVAMWQFMQPAVVDTSQDHVLRPPVA
ncbi:transcription factor ILR3-like isoform X2 [Solanum stenotomum]|uniref:transcription factor ILR3-like isoform X2 n=1 Tax=Solanum stenotomum TaxID=172797 RepID=UPI0020D1E71A|nr:transcription factor ILR3-like isoform X2 [Solanum stenotomum]